MNDQPPEKKPENSTDNGSGSDVPQPKRKQTGTGDTDEAAMIMKETIEMKLEMDYDDLRDKALNAWYEIKEYLEMRGCSLLDKCTFPMLMTFCENVMEIPKEVDQNLSMYNLMPDHCEDYSAMDPY